MFGVQQRPQVWYNLRVKMIPTMSKCDAVVFLAMCVACAVIAQKGTNDPPRGASAPYSEVASGGEIVGGRYELTSRVRSLDFAATNSTALFMRGKNPLDADAKAYIDAHVDPEFVDYAWMIAKHESKSGSRVYNQFNPADPLKELPNKTAGQNMWCCLDFASHQKSCSKKEIGAKLRMRLLKWVGHCM